MKIMIGIEAVYELTSAKTDSRDQISLICEDLLMPKICCLYEELEALSKEILGA
jgi:hypothetical protein